MSPISNFTQAVKELTGFDEDVKTKDKDGSRGEEPVREYNESFAVPQRNDQPKQRLDINMPSFAEGTGTLITRTMTISGSVEGNDQVKVDGSISGDLRTASSAVVNGKILGNISTDSLAVSGSVKGTVHINGDARIESSAVVVGDVQSGNLSVRGKVKGNLQVKQITDIAETAVVVGDISTGELNSERGCVINGNVSTRDTRSFNFDEEKLFNIGE